MLFGAVLEAALAPMTGVAFVLFTFYMVPDPGTTPTGRREQVIFGASVAFAYAVLQVVHVVYGLFFALAIVCTARGALLWLREAASIAQARAAQVGVPLPAMRSGVEGGT